MGFFRSRAEPSYTLGPRTSIDPNWQSTRTPPTTTHAARADQYPTANVRPQVVTSTRQTTPYPREMGTAYTAPLAGDRPPIPRPPGYGTGSYISNPDEEPRSLNSSARSGSGAPSESDQQYEWEDFWNDYTTATAPQELTDFSSWAEQYGLPPDLIRILGPLMEQLKANGSDVFQPTYSLFTPTVNSYNPNTGIMQAIWNAVSGMI